MLYKSEWFAWFPVRVGKNKKWVWLKNVIKTEDSRPVEYLGLTPTIYYTEI